MADAVVVGSGPNGLAAAIELARGGCHVTVFEAEDTIGGGARTMELTLPGFMHDICSAFHPLGASSPFFRTIDLARRGLAWIEPSLPLAHPLDDGTAVALHRSVEQTADGLGADAAAYRRLMGPIAADWDALVDDVLGPVVHVPRHPLRLARFGALAVLPARFLAERAFRSAPARALFAGLGAHAILPLEAPLTGAFALTLGASAHAAGWPIARGGSGRIADALAAELRLLGGSIVAGRRIRGMADLPAAHAYVFDVMPASLERIAGARLPAAYRRRMRGHRLGPGVFKIDHALSAPVPWRAAECALAGTVHLGGTLEEIASAEAAVARGEHPERPFLLVGQQSLFDPTRAPAGRHTLWTYCHVPNGSTVDMTERIEAQIERFAPGFRDVVLARRVSTPRDIEERNANHPGGDIAGGSNAALDLIFRPVARLDPYADAGARHHAVLVGDATGRRRPRDVRLSRSAERAAEDGSLLERGQPLMLNFLGN